MPSLANPALVVAPPKLALDFRGLFSKQPEYLSALVSVC